MKASLFRFTLSVIIIYLTGEALNPAVTASQPSGGNGAHFCGVTSDQWNKQYSDQFLNRHYARTFAANLNVGEPRTVRMIYFLPNDRPYRADVVQRMKDEIRNIQTFYAEQMLTHGYGYKTFHFETDPQGEPVVHRVDGGHPNSHYLDKPFLTVPDEIVPVFDFTENIYFIVIDSSADIALDEHGAFAGVGGNIGKSGGGAWVFGEFHWTIAAHELGHAFGLPHDFRNDAYIMSYGSDKDRLSVCSAEFLSVHPYFNPDIPIEEGQPPTIELISSPKYLAGSESVSIQLALNDLEGLHQVFLLAEGWAGDEVFECRGLAGEKDAIVEFNYDGSSYSSIFGGVITRLSDQNEHPIWVSAIDTDGNMSNMPFVLEAEKPSRVPTLVKISGVNQQGPTNTPLAQPFVVEARDQYGSLLPGALVTFSVITGEGRLSGQFSAEDDDRCKRQDTEYPHPWSESRNEHY